MSQSDVTSLVLSIVGLLFGGGGIAAYLKARSEIRNANKSADIDNMAEALKTIQDSYQQALKVNEEELRKSDEKYSAIMSKLQERLQKLETDYLKQVDCGNENLKRITDLEIQLKMANSRIETLENELHIKITRIAELEKENEELRRVTGKKQGLMK